MDIEVLRIFLYKQVIVESSSDEEDGGNGDDGYSVEEDIEEEETDESHVSANITPMKLSKSSKTKGTGQRSGKKVNATNVTPASSAVRKSAKKETIVDVDSKSERSKRKVTRNKHFFDDESIEV